MSADQSRKKSLYFLLLNVLRSRSNTNNEMVRALITSLSIDDLGDDWQISTNLNGEISKHIVKKSEFSLYQTKPTGQDVLKVYQDNRKAAEIIAKKILGAMYTAEEKQVQEPGGAQSNKLAVLNLILFSALLLSHLFQPRIAASSLMILILFSISSFLSKFIRNRKFRVLLTILTSLLLFEVASLIHFKFSWSLTAMLTLAYLNLIPILRKPEKAWSWVLLISYSAGTGILILYPLFSEKNANNLNLTLVWMICNFAFLRINCLSTWNNLSSILMGSEIVATFMLLIYTVQDYRRFLILFPLLLIWLYSTLTWSRRRSGLEYLQVLGILLI